MDMKDKWEFYKVADILWRCQHIDSDGNIVEVSTDGHGDVPACFGNARRNGWDGLYVNFPHPDALTKGAK
jgi:hypothetical protein